MIGLCTAYTLYSLVQSPVRKWRYKIAPPKTGRKIYLKLLSHQ